VEAGNFAPAGKAPNDSLKALAISNFYRRMKYDAVGLSSRETAYGFDFWRDLAKDSLPVLAANVFTDAKAKKPLFKGWKSSRIKSNGQYLIKEDHGERLGVISFVSATAWKARRDTTVALTWKSPFEFGKEIKKLRKKCDELVVVGEFSLQEADSFARVFPMVNLIVSSGIRTDQMSKQGATMIVGSSARGNFANYVEWNGAPQDTTQNYVNKSQVLDSSVPEDTTWTKAITQVNEQIKAGVVAPPKKP
jgi:2',3'-cyclic-nucleotide 2'-phosphodiesterase (5'-nucleotidase family)